MRDKNKHDELISRIIGAFQDVPYPSDEKFSPVGDEERDCINALLRGKDWRDVRGNTFQNRSSGLPLLKAEVFCYYLPALMLNALEEPTSPTYNDMLTTFTLYALEPDYIIWEETSEQPLALLTTDQRKVVLSFLRYYLQTHPEDFRRRRTRDILYFWREALVKDVDSLKEAAKLYATKWHPETTQLMKGLDEDARERGAEDNPATYR